MLTPFFLPPSPSLHYVLGIDEILNDPIIDPYHLEDFFFSGPSKNEGKQ